MAVFNKFVRYLTKRHDAKLARNWEYSEDMNGTVKLSDVEQVPSVMLAFNIIESKRNEDAIVRLLTKIFEKNDSLKTQYSSAGETLLFAACRNGKSKVVDFLVENGLNCKQVTPLGTAMHSLLDGLQKGNMPLKDFEAMTKLLQEHGCNIDNENYRHMSPFLLAVELGNIEATKLYIKLKCDINKKGVSGYHAIHLACLKYRPDILQFLLSLNGISANPISDDGSTPLYMAVKEWNNMCTSGTCFESTHLPVRFKQSMQVLALVEVLLQAGADPYMINTKQSINLPAILLNIRMEECNRGRWCKKCRQNNSFIQQPSAVNQLSLEHICDDLYIGCPCKLTSLYIGDQDDEDDDTEMNDESSTAEKKSGNSSVFSGHSPGNRQTMYGSSAVPLTSQMLATCLLYGHHCDVQTSKRHNIMKSFLERSSKLDLVDPYLQYLLRYFMANASENQPVSLKVLSRSRIRTYLAGQAKLQCLQMLPLPKMLLNYISMKVLV